MVELARWPCNGFESLFDYVSNFVHSNINLGSEQACKKYRDRWMAHYRKVIQSWDEFEIAAWTIRLRQSLKLAFSGTYFALSSRVSDVRERWFSTPSSD